MIEFIMGGRLNALLFIYLTAIPLIYDEFQRNAPAALYLPYNSLSAFIILLYG